MRSAFAAKKEAAKEASQPEAPKADAARTEAGKASEMCRQGRLRREQPGASGDAKAAGRGEKGGGREEQNPPRNA